MSKFCWSTWALERKQWGCVSPAGLPVLGRVSGNELVLLVYLYSGWSLFWFYFSKVSFAGQNILFLRRFFSAPWHGLVFMDDHPHLVRGFLLFLGGVCCFWIPG